MIHMKLKDGFVLHELGGRTVVIAVDERAEEFNGMITLNETAVEIWKLLKEDTTEEQVVAGITALFEGDAAFIAQDVHQFIAQLRANNLLEEEPA